MFVYLQCGDGIEAEKGSLTCWIRDIGRCSLTKYEDVLQSLYFFDEEVLNVIFRNSFLEEDFWIYIDRFFEY